jgi:hypothetical protein
MIVWGGFDELFNYTDTGGRYDRGTNSWTATSITDAPESRSSHTAVWTSNEMIVWGGTNGLGYFDTGGRYSPGMDSWTATSTANGPASRDSHTAVWTSNEMIIWVGNSLEPLIPTRAGDTVLNLGHRLLPHLHQPQVQLQPPQQHLLARQHRALPRRLQ